MRMNKATLVRVIACAVFLYFMFVVVTFVRRVPNNHKDDNYSSLQYGKSSTTTTTIKPPTTTPVVITTTPTTTTATTTTTTTTTATTSTSSIYPPFVLLTVNMNNVHLLIEQVLPCVYQTYPNTPIMLFGLNMNNQMTRYLQQLHLVHFVSIPLSKLVLDYDHEALDMESSDVIESWTQLVIKLCKSYPYTFINLHQNGRAAAGEEEPTPEATLLSTGNTGSSGTGSGNTGLFNRINIQSIHMNHWIRKCPNNDNNDNNNRMIPFKKLAVIVPFIDRQVDNLLEQIQRWSKPMYAPCTPTTINHNNNNNHNENDDNDDNNNEKKKKQNIKTDLIFFYHKEVNETLQELILSHLSPDTMMCFDKIVFRYARLLPSEDVYPVAANYMFYRLVHDPVIHTQYEYMFYSEPDTWAIRNNWIQVLLDLSFHSTMVPSFPSSSLSSSLSSSRRTYRSPSSSLLSLPSSEQQESSSYAEQYWVKGSIYRGPRRDLGRLSVNIHVNGNAIYHLVDDYLQFLKQVQVGIPVDAYDVAQTRYLFRDPTSLRLYWHKFHFSEFIQNLWQVEWDERQVRMNSVETVFVHGKTKYEPPATKLPPAANHL